MKKTLKLITLLFMFLSVPAMSGQRDVFDMKLKLNVPRVYENGQSLGYRKYQKQTITGEMIWDYDDSGNITNVTFRNFINKTHVMSTGAHVSYKTYLDYTQYPRFNAIGSNKTGLFTTPSVCFKIAAEPSYSIGELDEDNALYITLSGFGKTDKKRRYVRYISGNVSGTLGCGCTAYGHLSPTRLLGMYGWTDESDDVAGVHGTWKMQINKKKSGR